jgi:hypothetical protein
MFLDTRPAPLPVRQAYILAFGRGQYPKAGPRHVGFLLYVNGLTVEHRTIGKLLTARSNKDAANLRG